MARRPAAPAPEAMTSGTTPKHHGRGRHQDRTQPHRRRLLDGAQLGVAGALQLVGELHDEDAVLADQAEQRHQSHLRVDVERDAQHPEIDEEQCAEQRHRHRHQDDRRIAEALELRGERQIDDDQREEQRDHEAARAAACTAATGPSSRRCSRWARPACSVSRRNFSASAWRHPGRSAESRGVELLEVVDGLRHGRWS